jgi:hypothetical protein
MGRPWAIIDTAPSKSMSPQQDPMVRRPSHHRRGSGAEKNSTALLCATSNCSRCAADKPAAIARRAVLLQIPPERPLTAAETRCAAREQPLAELGHAALERALLLRTLLGSEVLRVAHDFSPEWRIFFILSSGIFFLGREHATAPLLQAHKRLEIRGTAKGQRRLIDLKPGEIRSVKLEITHNRDRSQVIDSDQK